MDNASAGMGYLCEDIRIGSEHRKEFIRGLKEEVATIRNNARKFLIESKKFHQGMGKELRDDLQGSKRDLIKMVSLLRKDFKKKNEELKVDLAEASRIWSEMSNPLRTRKAVH